jgi:hypothetical protein
VQGLSRNDIFAADVFMSQILEQFLNLHAQLGQPSVTAGLNESHSAAEPLRNVLGASIDPRRPRTPVAPRARLGV